MEKLTFEHLIGKCLADNKRCRALQSKMTPTETYLVCMCWDVTEDVPEEGEAFEAWAEGLSFECDGCEGYVSTQALKTFIERGSTRFLNVLTVISAVGLLAFMGYAIYDSWPWPLIWAPLCFAAGYWGSSYIMKRWPKTRAFFWHW